MKCIFIGFYWGLDKICKNSGTTYINKVKSQTQPITYREILNKFKLQMNKYKLEYYLEEHPEFDKDGMYQQGLSYKPFFIKRMLLKFKRPVVFMDLDLKIHKKPILFNNDYFDFMALNWNFDPRVNLQLDYNVLETASCVYYFNYTNSAIQLLTKWANFMSLHKNKADDRMLAIVFDRYNFINKLKCYWLPMEYLYIPQYHKLYLKDVVISHPFKLTSELEANKKGANKSRTLTDYDTITNKVRHINIIHEYPTLYFTKSQINHLKPRNIYFKLCKYHSDYKITKLKHNNISIDLCKCDF